MSDQSTVLYRLRSIPLRWWMVALFISLLTGVVYFEGIQRMVFDWFNGEEYSHGVLLPFICAYLIWQRRDELADHVGRGHWSGLLLIALCLAINVVGKYASVFALQQYSLVFTLYGLVICAGGWSLLRKILAPMLLLLLMVPLPNFFLNNLSEHLQLISSRLGVMFIRMVGISVFLEGNVIDLGAYKLQVAEACSGLRYLFPLLTMGFVMAYLFNASWWKRAIIFVSSVPLTVIMNSLRIGVIGVLVEHWGTSMAEGFLHQFQGWVVFMLSTVVLFLEVVLLSRLGRRSWRDLFGLDHRHVPQEKAISTRALDVSIPVWIGMGLLIVAVPVVQAIPKETEVVPRREYFSSFPLQLDGWQGKRGQLDRVYLDGLMLDDYLLGDFAASTGPPVNFYVAWYDSQQAGRSAHSPRSCLPGGGWHINSIERTSVAANSEQPLYVNRVLLEYGSQRQLVYYWFQQRGHVITNEYMVKWYLFWDSVTRHRSDGALVRIMTPVPEGTTVAVAETHLIDFIRIAIPKLTPFVPE